MNRFLSALMALGFAGVWLAAPSGAITYYVDANGGNDYNDGRSPANAWKTVQRVNGLAFLPGDAILFKRGSVWREKLYPARSGESGNPITFGAYGTGDNPILNGAEPITGWSGGTGGVYSASVETEPQMVFFGETRGVRQTALADLNAAGKWYWAGGTLAIYSAAAPANIEATLREFVLLIDTKNYLLFRDISIIRGYDAVWVANTADITLENLSVRDCAGYGGIFIASLLEGAGVRTTVRNCEVANIQGSLDSIQYANNGTGIFVYGQGICQDNLITGNTVHDCGHEGIVILDAMRNVVRENTVYGNAQSGIRVGNPSSEDNIVEFNESYGNCHGADDRFGIDLIRVGNNNVVRYNLVHEQRRVAGGAYGSGGIRFDGGDWAEHDFMDSTGNTAYYNVVYDEYLGITSFNFSYVTVYNNTVVNTILAALSVHSTGSVIPSGNIVINNLVYTLEGRAFFHDRVTGCQFDYNAYYPSAEATFVWAGAEVDFNTWRSVSGSDTHGVYMDPRFVDMQNHDFRLQTESPCINAGKTLGFNRDYAGTAVPQGAAADIGALESMYTPEGEGVPEGMEGETAPSGYALTVHVDPAGAGLALKSPSKTSYEPGDTVTLGAAPFNGWTFGYWEGSVNNPAAAATAITLYADESVTAHFEPVTEGEGQEGTSGAYTLTVSAAPPGAGLVFRTPSQDAYAAGSVVGLGAAAYSGWQFDHWEGGVADINVPATTITLDANETVLAVFVVSTAEGQAEGEGTQEGAAEGIPEGTSEGSAEGITEGGAEGTAEGLAEGETEGTSEGSGEGIPEETPSLDALAKTILEEFAAADKNHDGVLSLSEIQSVLPSISQSLFSLFDASGDNKLSVLELRWNLTESGPIHTADQNGDGRIALSELLRVIQFFNSQGYSCAEYPRSSEDGFLPGAAGLRTCVRHSSDYDNAAWSISLSELLRLIQFFNTGAYHSCTSATSEDGFCPGQ